MKKQLLSGIAIGLVLAMMPTVVFGQTNTAVQDYMKAQADYEAAQQEFQDAKDSIYWTTSDREEAESKAQAKVDEMAKNVETTKAATGMDDYTLNNAVKVETAKNKVETAKADEQAAKDDWYVFTSRTDAEQKAADNTKTAEENLAKVIADTTKSNEIKANADAAEAALSEDAVAEREQAIRDKVNAQYNKKEEEAQNAAQKEAETTAAYQAGKDADQAALDKAAADAQADYDAGNYADNIETALRDKDILAAKEEALAEAKKSGDETAIATAERELNEAKASTMDSLAAEEKFNAALAESDTSKQALLDAAGINSAGRTASDSEVQSAKEALQNETDQAKATANSICANEGAASMSCQQATQSAKELEEKNNKLIEDVENAQKNEDAAYQNYTDTVNKQSSANSQAQADQLKSEQAEKSAAVSQTSALANMRKGAFWDALGKVDSTKGDNFIDSNYAGSYQRAFDDTSTYAKALAGDAAATLKSAQGNLTDKQNALADATQKANESKENADKELASALDQQLLAQENKVAAAETALAEAQQAYDNASTPEEKAAAKAKLDEAQSNLTDAQISRDEFEKYADLQKQQNQAQETLNSANNDLAKAEAAYKEASSTPCASGDTACLQQTEEAAAAYEAAKNKQSAAKENLDNLSAQTADARMMAETNMSEDEIKALDSSLANHQKTVNTANEQINTAQAAVDNAQKTVDNAQKQQDIMDKVAAGTMTQEEADQAMKNYAKEQQVQSEVSTAEKKALTTKEETTKALEANQRQETAAQNNQTQSANREAAIKEASDRYELLSGQLLGNTIRDNVTNPITNATKSVTDYVSGGVKDIQTGVGDALYDTYKSITK